MGQFWVGIFSVELPAMLLADSAKATYKNGVLEVVFEYDRSDKKSITVD